MDNNPLYKLSKILESGDLADYAALFTPDAFVVWDSMVLSVEQARAATEPETPAILISFTSDYHANTAGGYIDGGELTSHYPHNRHFNGRYHASIQGGKIAALVCYRTLDSIIGVGRIIAVSTTQRGGRTFYRMDIISKESDQPLRVMVTKERAERRPKAGDWIHIMSFHLRGGPGQSVYNEIEAIFMKFI